MKARKFFKRFFIILILVILFIAGTGVVLTFIYSDEIKQFAIKQLNSYLNTEVQVKDVDFSIFRKFPDATIILNDVVVKSSNTYNKKDFKIATDTLLKAKTIYLQFDLWDALHKKYNLRAIQLDRAHALLCIDKKGKNNFTIFKESQENTNDSLNIRLEKLKFVETIVEFINASNDFELEAQTKDFKLSGDFYKDDFSLTTHGEIDLKKLMIQKVNYLKAKEAKFKTEIKVHNKEFTIEKGSLTLGNIKLTLAGSYQLNDETDAVNIKISVKQQAIEDLISSLPDAYQSYFQNISSKGNMDVDANIQGGLSYNIFPRIKVNFSINNGRLENTTSNTRLNELTLKGSFDNGMKQNLETTSFTIDTFYTVVQDSVIHGKFSIFNFSTPMVKFKLQGSLNLADWKSMLNLDTFQVLQGNISFNFDYFGKIKNLSNITASDYRNAIVKGKMIIKNASLQLQNNPYLIKNLTSQLRFHNNDVQTDNTMMEVNNSQVIIKGFLKNLIAFFMLDDEKLDATVQLNIDKLDLKDWQSNDTHSGGGFVLPSNIHLMGDVAIDQFDYNKFQAKQMRGFVELNSTGLYCSNLQFNTLEGSCSLSGKITINSLKEMTLQSEVKFSNINIKKMFQSFDNFGQTFLIDKHLQGKIKADIPFVQVRWDSTLNVIDKDILLDANIEITNGQLIDFEPIYQLADYIELNELKQIKFSTIKNDISIKDRKIIIPNMEVKTNAFNIEVSGEHTFDNQMEYRLKLLLREWLANKAKKNKHENEEFGIEENDGLGSTALYLIIKGTNDNYKISYDSKKMKEQVKESLKKEKQELKTILHEELGFFKKDTAFINQQKKQDEVKKTKFKISWDEDNPEQDKSE